MMLLAQHTGTTRPLGYYQPFFKSKKAMGFLLSREVKAIEKVLKGGQRPILAIIGGLKFRLKLKFLKI